MNYSRPSTSNLASIQEKDKGKRIRKEEIESCVGILKAFLSNYDFDAAIVESYATPISIVLKIKGREEFSTKKFFDARNDLNLYFTQQVHVCQDVTDASLIAIIISFKGRSIIGLKELIEDEQFDNADSLLTIAAGIDYLGNKIYLNLDDNPHMLIEGTTGSGKTIFLDNILMSLIFKASPEEVRFLLVDPKQVDLCPYEGIQHLYCPVITDMSTVTGWLTSIEEEMFKRYDLFADEKVKDIYSYNNQKLKKLPHIIVVIDEYKEVVDYAEKKFSEIVARIASRGRQAGIHLIISTQTASSAVIPNSIKSNMGINIEFSSATTVKGPDGRVRLLGAGDMMIDEQRKYRAQAAYVSYDEITRIVKSVRHRNVKI